VNFFDLQSRHAKPMLEVLIQYKITDDLVG
jgi:hypothetical protein